MRVVSLLPSATELLCAIGGEHLLVGRSHECDFPDTVSRLPALTGQRTAGTSSARIDEEVRSTLASGTSLYTLDTRRLMQLRPDVILTQDLCEVCSIDLNTVRAAAETMRFQLGLQPVVLSLNPMSIEDVLDDLLRIGEATGLQDSAAHALVALRERYWSARDLVNPYLDGPEVAFLEWLDPIFIGGHWTPQLIREAGGRHSLNAPGERSRQISADELVDAAPERLIICPCGFTLDDIDARLHEVTQQPWWSALPAAKNAHVALVDGSAMFNRPGPRLVDAFEWLTGWLNRDAPPLPSFPARMLAGASHTIR